MLTWRRGQCAASAVRRLLGCRLRSACSLLLLAALLAVRMPASTTLTHEFRSQSPANVAYFFGDFSNIKRMDDTIGAWWVEEEASNHTWWEYGVWYECGPRCRGRAQLQSRAARPPGEPHHGRAAPAHRLHLHDRRCYSLPLLPWPEFCEYRETDTVVQMREGGGARLTEETRGWCSALAGLLGGCGLRAAREQRARAVHAVPA